MSNVCRLYLTNQDEVEGGLVSCDDQNLELDTWYAGRMTIPRPMVQVIAPRPATQSMVFEGPAGLDGWTHGKLSAAIADPGEWKHKGAAFYASRPASIARDLKLPEVATIQFNLHWKGVLHLAIALYTEYLHPVNLGNKDQEPDFGGFYSLQLNSFTANLIPIRKREPLRYLGQTPVPTFAQKNQAQIEVRVNKPKRLVALMVDGILIKQWIDSEEFAGTGQALRFVHQGQGSVKLSNLRVYEWDGQFEDLPAMASDTRQDLARLRNGDRAVGDLQTIRNGLVTLLAAGNTIDIPLGRIKQIELAGQKSERAPDNPSQVRAYWENGGSLTFLLEEWDKQHVIANSPNFGRMTFHPSAFARVRFNAVAR
jgi:hypothetical protein